MPKETDRLKLPLPLGNENVTLESINGIFEKIDAGVATRDEVEALRQMMSEMDIPDASLTVKGKVQLSNKINGDSEERAPTEKALNDARLAAQKHVDDKTWQKFPLTQDNGYLKMMAANYDLNNLTTPGFYYVPIPTNSPGTYGEYVVEILQATSNTLIQRATERLGNSYTRYKSGTIWSAWVLQTPQPNVWGAL